jgi:hypothetical protein
LSSFFIFLEKVLSEREEDRCATFHLRRNLTPLLWVNKIWFPLALTLTFFRQEVDAKLRPKTLMENPTIANPPPSQRQLTENQREHHVRVVVNI